jgi:two-component system sensor histidine kinase KdpD
MELHLRREQGIDVAIGFVETYGRPMTIKAIGDLEVIPRRKITYQGVTLEEMDTDAVIRRHPAIALVDELAHTNAPGSEHKKRWQDVEEILDQGITVISTVNIQHLESLADIVESVTGVQVRERIPDSVLEQADEIELVDLTPHALRQRIEQGNVYPPGRAQQALRQFFREGNLMALRELALRKVATEVEVDLEEYMRQKQIDAAWAAGESVLVCVTPGPITQRLIRRAWRMANTRRSQLLAVFVETPSWASAGPEERRELEENFRFAEDLGAECMRVQDSDVAQALVRVAHEKNAAMIVIGHSRRGRLREWLRESIAAKLLRLARDVDIHVVANPELPE